MFRVINEYMSKVNICTDNAFEIKVRDYIEHCSNIEKFTLSVSFNQYILDIKLKKYSVERAAELFKDFNNNISYDYSSFYVRFNEGKCVRYRYLTSKENKKAIYCDIIIK